MNYLKCKAALDSIKADDNKIEEIISELGDGIDELFIASSDFSEMNSDIHLLRDNDFELAEQFLTSKNNDYCLWVITDGGILTQVPQTFEK